MLKETIYHGYDIYSLESYGELNANHNGVSQSTVLLLYNNKFIILQVVKLYCKRDESYNFVNSEIKETILLRDACILNVDFRDLDLRHYESHDRHI